MPFPFETQTKRSKQRQKYLEYFRGGGGERHFDLKSV